MKLSNLRDIVAVAEAGSLRGASRLLGISQPSITRSMRDLEHELGAMLFERRQTGIKLTPIGEAYVRRATAVFSELRRGKDEVDQLKGRSSGQVSIALTAGSGIALMPSILPNFRKRYPSALLQIAESMFQPVEADIRSGTFDFFVGPLDDELSTTTLSIEKLFDNHRVVIARRGHPLARIDTLRDLVGAQWIRPSFSTQRGEADFEAMFERANLPQPEIVMHTRSAIMTLLAVANSDLLTVLPIQWLELAATADRVTMLHLADDLHAAPMCIVRRGDLPLTPMAEHLCDLVRKAGMNYKPRN
jgi:LysR family transcriptional regulator of abg operon